MTSPEINMSMEEVFRWLDEFQKDDNVLLNDLLVVNPSIGHMVEKMRSVITSALAGEGYNDPPGDLELANLNLALMHLPYLLIQNKTPDTWPIAEALVLLISNYLSLYPNPELQEVASNIYSLIITKNEFKLLINACAGLLHRCEIYDNSHVDIYGISKSFTDRLLKLKEDPDNDSASSN